MTPELFAHVNQLNGCVTLHGKQSAIVVPCQTTPTTEACSIACQTDLKELADSSNENNLSINVSHCVHSFLRLHFKSLLPLEYQSVIGSY